MTDVPIASLLLLFFDIEKKMSKARKINYHQIFDPLTSEDPNSPEMTMKYIEAGSSSIKFTQLGH